MYFLAHESVLHPETREPLITAGHIVHLNTLQTLHDEYGVDHVRGEWLATANTPYTAPFPNN